MKILSIHDGHNTTAGYFEDGEKESGFGGLMNTSFNLHAYLIVNEVLDTFWVFEMPGLNIFMLKIILLKKTVKR
ncbi:MAG: hypothetical protein NT038_10420 [Euryarchaeota archaeon]|nr:hypothetical protein [Euryarchaeota archaeon]